MSDSSSDVEIQEVAPIRSKPKPKPKKTTTKKNVLAHWTTSSNVLYVGNVYRCDPWAKFLMHAVLTCPMKTTTLSSRGWQIPLLLLKRNVLVQRPRKALITSVRGVGRGPSRLLRKCLSNFCRMQWPGFGALLCFVHPIFPRLQ